MTMSPTERLNLAKAAYIENRKATEHLLLGNLLMYRASQCDPRSIACEALHKLAKQHNNKFSNDAA